MSLIKTLMGRRQFLIAAGVASTCALTCKKLAGFETRAAMAAEQAAIASYKGGRQQMSSSFITSQDQEQGAEEQDNAHRISHVLYAGAGKFPYRDV